MDTTRRSNGIMKKPSLAVIILTANEELNLGRALDSVRGWAEEVFVVDSYSTDATVDIALARRADGVRVVQHAFDGYAKQWNWALARLPVRAAWTLKLDADEEVTDDFKREVNAVIEREGESLEGISLQWRVVFLGAALRRGAVSGTYDLRIWRTGKARFEDRTMNEHLLVRGRTVAVRSHILHHTCTSLSGWLDKHNRYSSLEARNIVQGDVVGAVAPRLWGSPAQRRVWLRRLSLRMPARALAYFLYSFVIRLGFLDGAGGFRFAFLHAAYYYWINLKLRQYRLTGRLPDVAWPPRGTPHPVVAASALQRSVESAPAVNPVRGPARTLAAASAAEV